MLPWWYSWSRACWTQETGTFCPAGERAVATSTWSLSTARTLFVRPVTVVMSFPTSDSSSCAADWGMARTYRQMDSVGSGEIDAPPTAIMRQWLRDRRACRRYLLPLTHHEGSVLRPVIGAGGSPRGRIRCWGQDRARAGIGGYRSRAHATPSSWAKENSYPTLLGPSVRGLPASDRSCRHRARSHEGRRRGLGARKMSSDSPGWSWFGSSKCIG